MVREVSFVIFLQYSSSHNVCEFSLKLHFQSRSGAGSPHLILRSHSGTQHELAVEDSSQPINLAEASSSAYNKEGQTVSVPILCRSYINEAAVMFPWIGVVCVVRWLRSVVDWTDKET